MKYDLYNREERALCSHLFRLLHEKLVDSPRDSALSKVLNIVHKKNLVFKNKETRINFASLRFDNVGIFSEVALIRDAYENLKPNVNDFMDELTEIIKRQENVNECRLYSQLPKVLCDCRETHPKQIRAKAHSEGVSLSTDEMRVYGAVQAMFNAKPDLAITVDNHLSF